MRVIAGKARGTKLISEFKDKSARPTLDRVKESIFSTIQFDLKDAICLDAFACSGALGIEALSRGAKQVDFCEINKHTYKVLINNLSKSKLLEHSKLYNGDILEFLPTVDYKYDFVFLDPPYNKNLIYKFISHAIKFKILSDNSLIVAEHEKDYDMSDLNIEFKDRVNCIKRKDFSTTAVSYIKVEE